MIGPKKITVTIDGDRKVGNCLMKNNNSKNHKITTDSSNIFQTGTEELMSAVLDMIGNAKEMICVSSFIIQDSNLIAEIEAAAHRGVRVYILTAAETQIDSPFEDDNLGLKERKQASRDLLLNLGMKALIKTSEHLHSKFILVDPLDDPKGFLFTNNLTVRAMEENLELGVKLGKLEVKELFHQFLEGFWKEAEREIWLEGKESKLRNVNKRPKFVSDDFQNNRVIWTNSHQTQIREYLKENLSKAKKSISISAWTFDDKHEISKLIIDMARKGVKLRIFTRPHKANQDFFIHSIDAGAEIHAHPLLHAKSLVIDGETGIIMTSNISERGLDTGFETGIKLDKNEIEVLKRIQEEWVQRCEYVAIRNASLSDLKTQYYDLSKKFELRPAPLNETKKDVMPVTAPNMKEYYDGRVQTGNFIADPNALKTIINVNLFPPILPKKAKKNNEKLAEKFDVFLLDSRKFICVDNVADIPLALELGEKSGYEVVANTS